MASEKRKPKNDRITVKMNRELHRRLKNFCRKDGRMVETMLNIAVAQYLKNANAE